MKMYIDGAWIDASTGQSFDVINPATEEVIDTVPEASADDVDRAVASAKAAFDDWRNMSASDRAVLLKEASRKLEDLSDDLSTLLITEQGKLRGESDEEFEWAVKTLDFYTQLIQAGTGNHLPSDSKDVLNFTVKEPYGPTACLIPFNYPVLLLYWKIAPALAAGNTIIIKPSEKTPLTTLKIIEQTFDHLPKGVINCITGGAIAGQALVTHPDVPTVAFTGSTAVGIEIIKSTAHQVKNLLLELGGKDAAVVTEDIDIKIAARALASSSFWNAGQICTSTERIYVQKSVYDEFVKEMKACVSQFTLGPGGNEATNIAPMCGADGFQKAMDHVKDATLKGATLECGGKRSDAHDKGFYFDPTILSGVNHDMLVMREETFAPVVAIMPYDTIEDAIDLVNGTEYGLGAVIMSENPRDIKKFYSDVKAGTIWINDPLPDNLGGPFGGMKTSSFGDTRELGIEGLHAYMETKHVHWNFAPEKIADDAWFDYD